jgi:hypothetical protein
MWEPIFPTEPLESKYEEKEWVKVQKAKLLIEGLCPQQLF